MVLSIILDQCSTLVCVVILVYASWLDIKIGIVPNRFWLVTLLAAGLLSIHRSITHESISESLDLFISVGVTLPMSLLLFKCKIFGGSDAKALIMLSIFVPKLTPLLGSSGGPLVASVSATINLMEILMLVLVVNALRNLAIYFIREGSSSYSVAPPTRKLLYMVAYKRLRHAARSPVGEFHPELTNRIAPTHPLSARKSRAEKECAGNIAENTGGYDDTTLWVPLRIPLIPLLVLSLIISLLLGDFLAAFVAGLRAC